MNDLSSTRFVISVLAPDCVGIMKNITSAVSDMGANIDGISQTVVEGYFTVILTASFPQALTADEVHRAVCGHFNDPQNISILVRPFTERKRPAAPGKINRYILTVSGRDRPGILKTLTVFLAAKHINIEDLYFRLQGPDVIHVGEVTVPDALDIKQLQCDLQNELAPMELNARLQHENLFIATNEIGSIQLLLRGGAWS